MSGRPSACSGFLNRNPEPYPDYRIIGNSNLNSNRVSGDKILSYPYPPRNMLSNLNSKAMDKISSYPSGLLEADARAESYWARAPNHLRGPVIGANSNSNGPKLLGPFAHSLGKPK